MSGGYFDYIQRRLWDIPEQIERAIDGDMQPLTVARFREAADTVERAQKMVQRVDWFLSGDDNEESFNRRWEEDGLLEECKKMIDEQTGEPE